ncbi:hypothetical protein SDC9_59144 [bioreactor metagenome]|uniref:Polysaccharide chain length determinant N-terminal domain-containing protein n=1 Tax=bioreactor metagenome TaxID=1076179 RepID=A0A644X9E8_9ZZZZ
MKESTNPKELTFENTNFLFFLFKWRKLLIIVSVAAVVVSAGISLLIKNKYVSTVVMFPSSTNAVSKALISSQYGVKEDIMAFGEEEEAEQMLQILNSNEIRQRIIAKFNLLEHYDIDPDSKYKNTKLYQTYNDNISFNRTEYMAVEIRVVDTDPQMAADIANEIANLYDTVKINLQKQRSLDGFKIVEGAYLELQGDIQKKEDSLSVLRSKGVQDYESQAERLYEGLAREIGNGNTRAIQQIQQRLDTLAKYGSAYVSLRDGLEHDKKQLSDLKGKYEEAKVDAESSMPQKFVVDYAFKAEKKTYPVRWLIVVISTFATLLTSIILIILYENFKKFKLLSAAE